jgi:hypothetical protein
MKGGVMAEMDDVLAELRRRIMGPVEIGPPKSVPEPVEAVTPLQSPCRLTNACRIGCYREMIAVAPIAAIATGTLWAVGTDDPELAEHEFDRQSRQSGWH